MTVLELQARACLAHKAQREPNHAGRLFHIVDRRHSGQQLRTGAVLGTVPVHGRVK